MKKYGLVGKTLKYSYSKIIHEYLIAYYNIDATYELIETESIDKNLLKQYAGLNVTIPFKETVLKYLDEINTDLGCNTIVNDNGYLKGYNTDIEGFKLLLNKLPDNKYERVVILGSGASSKMIQSVLKGKEIIVISRQNSVNNYDKLSQLSADLLINTTPVGMNEYNSPIAETDLINYHAIIDLNYNPLNSKLALTARKHNIIFQDGLMMLIKQAIAAFQIWHNIKVADSLLDIIYIEVLKQTQTKIALIGPSLSGKTTSIYQHGGIDLDAEVERMYAQKIDTMLSDGSFREKETIVLKKLVAQKEALIACGGGIVLNHHNMELLKNYLIIYLKCDINILKERLKKETRPLIKDEKDLGRIIEERAYLYKKYANITFNPEELEEFLDEVGYH